MLKKGWRLEGNSQSIQLHKGSQSMVLDQLVHTTKGVLYCIHIKRKNKEMTMINTNNNVSGCAVNNKCIDSKTQSDVQNNNDKAIELVQQEEIMTTADHQPINSINTTVAHSLFGHIGEQQVREICKYLNIKIVRSTLPPCNSCAVAKVRQKNLPTSTTPEPNRPLHKIGIDISTIKPPKHIKTSVYKPNWLMIIDHLTGYKAVSFHNAKNAIIKPTIALFKMWEYNGYKVNYIRCDNAGENLKLQKKCEVEGMYLSLIHI